jgi:hypothetical protein
LDFGFCVAIERPLGKTKVRIPKSQIGNRPLILASCSCFLLLLLGRCLDIDVDLLSTAASKDPIPINKEEYEHYDDENRDNRDYARITTTPTTIIIVSHGAAPYAKL